MSNSPKLLNQVSELPLLQDYAFNAGIRFRLSAHAHLDVHSLVKAYKANSPENDGVEVRIAKAFAREICRDLDLSEFTLPYEMGVWKAVVTSGITSGITSAQRDGILDGSVTGTILSVTPDCAQKTVNRSRVFKAMIKENEIDSSESIRSSLRRCYSWIRRHVKDVQNPFL